MKRILSTVLALFAIGGVAQAELLPGWPSGEDAAYPEWFHWHGDDPGLVSISSYDINDAWLPPDPSTPVDHHYNGTITRSGTFFEHTVIDRLDGNYSYSGEKASYSGGTGTLTDGYIGWGMDDNSGHFGNTMHFVTPQATDGTSVNPVISFALTAASTINTIDLYGAALVMDAKGAGTITDLTVTLIKSDLTTISENFTTLPFGYNLWDEGIPAGGTGKVNDRIDLTGTSLEGVEAIGFKLSNFESMYNNQFTLSEVRAFDGPPIEVLPPNGYLPYDPIETDVPTAPEPSTLAMLSLGGGLGIAGRWIRRRRKPAA